jgi:hypothetical protein
MRALAQDSSQKQYFTEKNLLQHGSSAPEELLSFIEAAVAWLYCNYRWST